jgi:hypothetical protein
MTEVHHEQVDVLLNLGSGPALFLTRTLDDSSPFTVNGQPQPFPTLEVRCR